MFGKSSAKGWIASGRRFEPRAYQGIPNMCKKERQTGHEAGPVTIGSVVVAGRWRYSYVEGPELPDHRRSQEEFKFVVALTLSDRKKLINLKKGDWTALTAGPFREMP